MGHRHKRLNAARGYFDRGKMSFKAFKYLKIGFLAVISYFDSQRLFVFDELIGEMYSGLSGDCSEQNP